MKKILLIGLSLFLSSAASFALTIKTDHGGMIGPKYLEVLRAKKSGEIVRIDGLCDSSCTLHLSNPRSCATVNASLGFHAATNKAGTEFLWRNYPQNIRSYISSHGGLTRKLIVVRGRAAQNLIGAC